MTDLGNKVDAAGQEVAGNGHPDHDTAHEPVVDWATDFDHTDRLGRRPVPDLGRAARHVSGRALRPLRRRLAPGAHDDVAAVAYDTDHFTSRA